MLRRRVSIPASRRDVFWSRDAQPDFDRTVKRQLRGDIAQGRDFLGDSDKQDKQIQHVRMVSYAMFIPTLGVVTKVLDQNLQRVRVIIPNNTGAVMFVSFAVDDLDGIPVASNGNYMEIIGTVTAGMIFVRTTVNSKTVVAYEGVPVIGGR